MNFFKIIVGSLAVGCPVPFFMTLRIGQPECFSPSDDVTVDVESVFAKFNFCYPYPRGKEIPVMSVLLTSVAYEVVKCDC